MMEAGVPVVPGTKEPVYDAATGEKLADGDRLSSYDKMHLQVVVEKECEFPDPKKILNSIQYCAERICQCIW